MRLHRLAAALACFFLASPAYAQTGVTLRPGTYYYKVVAMADDNVRVYVFTQASEFTDKATQERQDSVTDLRKALAERKGLMVVEDDATAQIKVEVLGRGYESRGTTSTYATPSPGGAQGVTIDDKVVVLRARLVVGTYALDIDSGLTSNMFTSNTWKNKADKLAKQIEKWVRENREKLTQ